MDSLLKEYKLLVFFSLVLTILVSLFFIAFPKIDLEFSGLFWEADKGFYLHNNPIVYFLYKYNYVLVIIYLITCVLLALYCWGYKKGKLCYSKVYYLVASLLIGPGIVVNGILKSFWGRARPENIVEFGGDKLFTRAWQITDQCDLNCSFVSGHASTAFSLYAFALLSFTLIPKKKFFIPLLTIVSILGLIASFGRIVEGRHFLSDTLISGLLVWCISLTLYYPILRKYINSKQ